MVIVSIVERSEFQVRITRRDETSTFHQLEDLPCSHPIAVFTLLVN